MKFNSKIWYTILALCMIMVVSNPVRATGSMLGMKCPDEKKKDSAVLDYEKEIPGEVCNVRQDTTIENRCITGEATDNCLNTQEGIWVNQYGYQTCPNPRFQNFCCRENTPQPGKGMLVTTPRCKNV